MTAPRMVLDTNVLISAIVFGGRPREVLEKVISGTFGMAISDLVQPTTKVEEIKADPADNRILECALESSAACIVTGDRHLLELGQLKAYPFSTSPHFSRATDCVECRVHPRSA